MELQVKGVVEIQEELYFVRDWGYLERFVVIEEGINKDFLEMS